jgi:hypothetical protein
MESTNQPAEKEIDTKAFIHDSLEAILNLMPAEGTNDPYAPAAEAVAKKYGITTELFKWVHHPFHWYLVNEEKIIAIEMQQSSGEYVYKKAKEFDLEKITADLLDRYGTVINARMKAVKEGKYGK